MVGADPDAFDLLRLDIIRLNQVEDDGHCGMSERSRGMRLNRNAGLSECPGRAELVPDRGIVISAAGSMIEAATGFQDISGSRKAARNEVRRQHRALG